MAKRRRHGEGTVYQRADGKWVGAADLGYREVRNADGEVTRKRVRKTVIRDTERAATRALRDLIRDVESGIAASTMSVEAWLTHWLTDIAPKSVRPSTLTGYRSKIELYLIPTIGTKRLDRLTPDDLRRMHETLAGWTVQPRSKAADAVRPKTKLSPTTIRQAHAVLRSALAVALAEGRVSRNVATIQGPPAAAANPHEILSTTEAGRVIRAASSDPRGRARVLCALVLGLRQGEALGLRWPDITLADGAGVISVRETVQRVRGDGLSVGAPKTRSSIRRIPLPPIVAGALLAWREVSGGAGYVFHGHSGPLSPEDPRRDWQAWTDLLAAAGVPHVPLHGARGSAATLLMALGTPDRMIADILGHAQVKTSQAHYLHSDESQLLEYLTRSSDALEALSSPADEPISLPAARP